MHTVCIYNAYVAYAFNQNTIQYNRCVCVCALSAHVLFQRILRRTKTSHNVEIVYAIPTPQFISLCVVHGVDANTQMDNGMCGIVTPTHTQTNIYEYYYTAVPAHNTTDYIIISCGSSFGWWWWFPGHHTQHGKFDVCRLVIPTNGPGLIFCIFWYMMIHDDSESSGLTNILWTISLVILCIVFH